MRISKKEWQRYMDFMNLVDNGKVLTPDGIRFIVEACDKDPRKIGLVMLEFFAKNTDNRV